MSLEATLWAWKMQAITALEKLVLLSLADRAGETHEAWPSWSRLSFDTCSDRKTVGKALKSLSEKGIIKKTGKLISRVPIYILIGVESRSSEKLSTKSKSSSTKSGTIHKTSSTKNGTRSCPKSGTRSSTKNGTQNLSVNLQENLPRDSSFFNIKKQTQERLEQRKIPFTEDILCQIEYYAMKHTDQREATESIDIAISLHAKKQWNIPSGYNGITAKSIAEKEAREEYDRREQFQEDAVIMRNVLTDVAKTGLTNLKSIFKDIH